MVAKSNFAWTTADNNQVNHLNITLIKLMTLCNNFSQKGGWAYFFRVGTFSEDYGANLPKWQATSVTAVQYVSHLYSYAATMENLVFLQD